MPLEIAQCPITKDYAVIREFLPSGRLLVQIILISSTNSWHKKDDILVWDRR